MSYLRNIVDFINVELDNGFFDLVSKGNKNIVGLAQALPRKTGDRIELIPSYVTNDGEAAYIGPDDDFNLIAYHRVNSIVAGKANLPAYGDNKQVEAHVARMSLVVFARRDMIDITYDDAALYTQASFPAAVSKDTLSKINFRAANINVTDIVLNDLQVFQEEYQGVVFFLKPEQFLYKVNYTIESAFLKGCFNKFSD